MMKNLPYVFLCALALALPAPAQQEHAPPPYNDPGVPHDCSNTFLFDSSVGADELHFQSYPNPGCSTCWVPYLIINGTANPVYDECGMWDSYTSAGEIGKLTSVILRSNPPTVLNEGAIGLLWWGASYVSPPYYSPLGGWSMLGPPIVATWGLGDNHRFYGPQGWIGWRRLVVWPDDPDLVGVTLYAQGWCADGPSGGGGLQVSNLSGTWMLTFTDQQQQESVIELTAGRAMHLFVSPNIDPGVAPPPKADEATLDQGTTYQLFLVPPTRWQPGLPRLESVVVSLESPDE